MVHNTKKRRRNLHHGTRAYTCYAVVMAFPTRRVVGFLAALVAGVSLTAGLYTVVVLNWSYSTGDRAGTLLKLSHKGWICKTWEGELVMPVITGASDEQHQPGDLGGRTWNFTVRDDAAVANLQAAVGKRVVLTYSEHKGVPGSCFGDTPYYVENVRLEDPPAPAPAPAVPAVPAVSAPATAPVPAATP